MILRTLIQATTWRKGGKKSPGINLVDLPHEAPGPRAGDHAGSRPLERTARSATADNGRGGQPLRLHRSQRAGGPAQPQSADQQTGTSQ